MELLGDVGLVEYRFFPFGDSVGVGQVTWVMWNLTSFRLETVLVSVHDECKGVDIYSSKTAAWIYMESKWGRNTCVTIEDQKI